MQNEISGLNGHKDMVSFSFEWFFNLYTMITTVSVHYLWGVTVLVTLKPHHPLYTWCTMVRSLWHVEWNIWNLLVQTACLYTSCKWGKRVLKLYCEFLAKIALLEISAYISICCLCAVKIAHLEDSLRCKTKYVDRMDPKIWLVFDLKWFFNLFTMITTVTVHYLWYQTGQPTLKPHHPLYTWCTMVRSLWHVESNIWTF